MIEGTGKERASEKVMRIAAEVTAIEGTISIGLKDGGWEVNNRVDPQSGYPNLGVMEVVKPGSERYRVTIERIR